MRSTRNYSTHIPGLIAVVTIKELKDGRVRAEAEGIEPEDEKPYDKLGKVISKAVSSKRKQFAINEAIKKLEDLFFLRYGHKPADEDDMAQAFRTIKRRVLEEDFALSPGWTSKTTNEHAISFFERNILMLLLPFSNPEKRQFLDKDRLEIRNSLARRYDKSKDTDDISTSALESAEKRMVEASIIYAHMQNEDERLPSLLLRSDAPVHKAPKKEQLKSLPRTVLIQFYKLLKEHVQEAAKNVTNETKKASAIEIAKKVFFAVLVIFGLRPAEAAGLKPNDIVYMKGYCIAEVSRQERDGMLDHRLKTNYSRRLIIISYWGHCLLKLCASVIGDNYPKDDCAMNNAVECSRWTKNLLIKSGTDVDFFLAVKEDIDEEDLDYDDKKNRQYESEKIACYILRRIFAGIARNVMGLSAVITDLLMGHVPVGRTGHKENKASTPDLNASDTQRVIAEKMERYIFDPEFSLNPACMTIETGRQDRIHLIEYSEYNIKNTSNKKCTLQFNLVATECGETISVSLPNTSAPKLNHTSTPKSWEGIDRTVIGDTTIPKEGT